MAHYSVATTKDKLSSLIDKALAGEEVIITRHGKPTVALRMVEQQKKSTQDMVAWLEKQRSTMPNISITSLELKRLDQADYER
ncbi:type II toxin-antitoxin system Phd/YefM family antitoxin [Sphingobium boeckii]|uniref:Antitoxin n=1 Tax=Sphingobium boeckii TaxID=1082345 RepID=A0A7W9EE33_9SPHN|nr:type II toxin-antitoxin system prevent-host-death family antitoxin [Sphingobium boeckii]MBB5685579.1 prevent-host-death family protein [Sphingobium boeckii]